MQIQPSINSEVVVREEQYEGLDAKLDIMKREIDGLQIIATSQKKPWYREISTIIAVLALLFSFGTTAVSYRRTQAQDVQASRQELRGILQRLSAIPRDNFDASRRYKGDETSVASISQLYAQENAMLSRQAAEIARNLPTKVVSATEYYEIGVALQNAYNVSGAREFLNLAQNAATDFNDEIAALRSSANLEFIMGKVGEGRVKYQQSLNIFQKYPNFDPYTQSSTNIWTELAWANAEAGQGQFSLASLHADNAQKIVDVMPYSPGAETLKLQIAQTKAVVSKGIPQTNSSSTGGSSSQTPK